MIARAFTFERGAGPECHVGLIADGDPALSRVIAAYRDGRGRWKTGVVTLG